MAPLPLFEGIIVRPSGGRRKQTPHLDLPGTETTLNCIICFKETKK